MWASRKSQICMQTLFTHLAPLNPSEKYQCSEKTFCWFSLVQYLPHFLKKEFRDFYSDTILVCCFKRFLLLPVLIKRKQTTNHPSCTIIPVFSSSQESRSENIILSFLEERIVWETKPLSAHKVFGIIQFFAEQNLHNPDLAVANA